MKFIGKLTTAKAALLSLMMSTPFAATAGGPTFQMTNILDFPALATETGSAATLTRKRQSLHANLVYSALDTNSAYTVWWAIYNNPEHCVNGPGQCGMPDITNPAAELSVFYATGFVTGNDGTANITVDLKSGKIPAGYDILKPGGLHRGNGKHAEVQLLLRTHGDIIPSEMASQIGTYNGTCNVNTCVETHMASFPSVD